MNTSTLKTPTLSQELLSEWGLEHLRRVIAIDSQSDERSDSIPSTDGQRIMAEDLEQFFRGLGYPAERDRFANLVVTIPARVSDAPKLALMVHIDTAEGTQALDELCIAKAWDGTAVAYPENPRLEVSADAYPATRPFLGEDVIHGPGTAPFGLDDKLGMTHLMTLARILKSSPEIPHGEVLLVFRPDEEIGRMAALESLAVALSERGVRHGYTIDGLAPFEINVENFNAAGGLVEVAASTEPVGAHRLSMRVTGVKSHGATAKAEGYLNALTITVRALAACEATVVPVRFETDVLAETNADVELAAESADALDAVLRAYESVIAPHRRRGAHLEVLARTEGPAKASVSVAQAVSLVERFIASEGPMPRLSEDSEGRQGYSNPYAVHTHEDGRATLRFRLRDFDVDGLEARAAHLRAVAAAAGLEGGLTISDQYKNMGDDLAKYPELVDWATDALGPLAVDPPLDPIRGGTGVDPFLKAGIGVANLGTGYFAPESEKELTSVQNLARHALWLTYLVQVVAPSASSER